MRFSLGGVLILRDVVWILCIFFFLVYFSYIYILYMGLVTILTYIVLIFFTHAIYYFCFTQRYLNEFCLKCFRNIGCQSLLVVNSLLAKFFKSLC